MPSHAKRVGRFVGRTQSSKKAIVTIEGEPIEELIGAQLLEAKRIDVLQPK